MAERTSFCSTSAAVRQRSRQERWDCAGAEPNVELGRDETRREAANHGESQRLVDVCKRVQLRKALPLNTDRGYC